MKKGRISSLLYMFLFAFVLSLAMGGISVKAEGTQGTQLIADKYNRQVDLDAKALASDGRDNGFYRYNVNSGEITCIDLTRNFATSDTAYDFAETYVYYALKPYYLPSSLSKVRNLKINNSAILTATEKTILDEEVSKLEAGYSSGYEKALLPSKSVTTEAPGVGTAKWLTVNTGVKKASVVWYSDYDNDVTFITGYIVKRYNAAGAVDAQYNTTATSLNCPLPYEGSYAFTVTPYYVFKGKTYYGAETGRVGCASAKIYSPTCLATKISNKVAKVTVNVPEGANGTILYQNVGGKWKEIGKTSYSKKYTVKKNTAGKRQYRVVSYVTDGGKTYYAAPSKAAKPQSNVCTCKYPKYAGGYKSASHFWRPIKISYSGNKVVVKGRFINTHIYSMNYFNIKLTVKAEGKVIGTKTIKCGKIKAKGTKVVTVKLDKSKKNMDLRNGSLYWSYKVIRADALN